MMPLTADRPKPMVEVAGRPFLEHLLEQLAGEGVDRFVLMTGYLGDQVHDHFGDGSDRGWSIEYSHGPAEWETARRLTEARDLLDDRFLLLYSDNYAPMDLEGLLGVHEATGCALTATLKAKESGNVRTGPLGRVDAYDASRTEDDLDHVEIGYMVVERDRALGFLDGIAGQPDVSLSAVLEIATRRGALGGHVVGGPYFSISDPTRLEVVRRALGGRRIVLMDRDGTINRPVGRGRYVESWEAFEFRDDTVEAMSSLSADGFDFLVITNQAGLALGVLDPAEVDRIHERMVQELSRLGVRVLATYLCGDHWDSGSLRRKPAPGMFHEAAGDHDLALDKVLYVGDDVRDCLAAAAAGCGMVFLADETPPEGLPENRRHQSVHGSLLEALAAVRGFYGVDDDGRAS